MIITQEFYDNLQKNFISPLFETIDGTVLGDSDPININLEFMSLQMNMTSMTIQHAEISNKSKIIELGD